MCKQEVIANTNTDEIYIETISNNGKKIKMKEENDAQPVLNPLKLEQDTSVRIYR